MERHSPTHAGLGRDGRVSTQDATQIQGRPAAHPAAVPRSAVPFLRSVSYCTIHPRTKSTVGGIMGGMHAEAVKLGARALETGLMNDSSRTLNCEECDARYQLHYDSEAEQSSTYWSVLAQ